MIVSRVTATQNSGKIDVNRKCWIQYWTSNEGFYSEVDAQVINLHLSGLWTMELSGLHLSMKMPQPQGVELAQCWEYSSPTNVVWVWIRPSVMRVCGLSLLLGIPVFLPPEPTSSSSQNILISPFMHLPPYNNLFLMWSRFDIFASALEKFRSLANSQKTNDD